MHNLAPAITAYLKNLAKAASAPGAAPELSYRPSLDTLLQNAMELLHRKSEFNLINEGSTEKLPPLVAALFPASMRTSPPFEFASLPPTY